MIEYRVSLKINRYCGFAIYKITNLKIKIEKRVSASNMCSFVMLFTCQKEERLRTRYRKVTAYRS
jgi:hypothetical protein